MSIFDDRAHTIRVVRPFVWRDTYLKVHPNGAAVFAEDKRLAFFLPLIIEAHGLLPATPLFWTNDDKTIPLYRTTLWLHASTIQWIADTGEPYPPELRDEIQPRLNKLRTPQTPNRNSHLSLRNRREGRNEPTDPRRKQTCRQVRDPLYRTRKHRRHRLSNWLNMINNTWNCKQ